MNAITEQRLRSADPLDSSTDEQVASDRAWLRARAAEAVTRTADRGGRPHRARLILATAAATALVAGAGVVASGALRGDQQPAPVATPPPMELALGAGSPSLGSCIRFSVEILAQMPVAFGGTVVDSGNDQILLDVDHWYRGGEADQVALVSPDHLTISLEGGIDFQRGERYLVTATSGTVNFCGFSAPWSQSLADSFAAAFEVS